MQKAQDSIFPVMFEFGRLVRCRAKQDGKQALTLPQLEALWFVKSSGEPLMRDVAQYLKVKAPSATALIDELAKASLLSRVANPKDRREVRVQLTAKGERTLEQLISRKTKAIDDILSVLARKDREEFTKLLRLIVTAHK
jgi:DNA-binding MarR family transcriptional regulator